MPKRLKIKRTLLNHVSSILESVAVQFYTGFKKLVQNIFVFIMNTLDPNIVFMGRVSELLLTLAWLK